MNSMLTNVQSAALKTFRKNVSDLFDEDPPDTYLLRWLKARDFSLKKSEQMLRTHIEWRKKYYIGDELIYKQSHEVCEKFYPGGVPGHDFEGSPIYILPVGTSDIKGVIQCCTQQDVIRHVLTIIEGLRKDCIAQSKKYGKLIDSQVYIFDMEGFQYSTIVNKAVIQMNSLMISIFEANFPETMKKAIVINAGWKEFLKTIADPSELPVYLGGTLTDPDGNPRCVTKIKQPLPVAPEYYKKYAVSKVNDFEYLRNEQFPVVGQCNINYQSYHEIAVFVPTVGSKLEWRLNTYSQHIDLIIMRCHGNHSEQPEVVHKTTRIISNHSDFHIGCLVCNKTGKCMDVIRFDNTFSWFTAKTVQYVIDISP